MCRTYNKNEATVITRLRKGWSLEKALTEQVKNSSTKIKCKDHLGNSYSSFSEMCRAYNKSMNVVKHRMERGYSLKDALTKEYSTICVEKECKDHLGNTYKSFKQMCEIYNKSVHTVFNRLNMGWSLEEALTKEIEVIRKSIVVFGIRYDSINEAVIKHNKSRSAVVNRLNNKFDIELAFIYPTTAPRIHFYYIGIDNKTRYKMGDNIYTAEELIAKYAPEYLELYRKTNPQGIYHFYKK